MSLSNGLLEKTAKTYYGWDESSRIMPPSSGRPPSNSSNQGTGELVFGPIDYENLEDGSSAGLFVSGFGNAEGTSYWDYVRYEICGAVAPEEVCLAKLDLETEELTVGDCLTASGCRMEDIKLQDEAIVACSSPSTLARADFSSLQFSSSVAMTFEPSRHAISGDGNILYIASEADSSVSVYNLENFQLIATAVVPSASDVSLDVDNNVLVTSNDNQNPSIYVMKADTLSLVSVHPVQRRPSSIIRDRIGNRFYVMSSDDNSIGVLKDYGKIPGMPSVRSGMGGVYNKYTDEFILFGGKTESGYSNELWVLEMATQRWSRKDLNTVPSPRAFYSYTYDPESGSMYIFGGMGPNGPLNDLWEYDARYHSFKMLDDGTASAPVERYESPFAYAETQDTLYLFGGTTGSPALNDLWAFDVKNALWRELTQDCSQQNCPPPTRGGVLVLSPDEKSLTIFKGVQDEEYREVGSWTFDIESEEWSEDVPTSQSKVISGGLLAIEYDGVFLLRKISEYIDSNPLNREWERTRRRRALTRWTGEIFIPKSGEYSFDVRTSGGFRMFIDEKKLTTSGCGRGQFMSCRPTDKETHPVHLDAGWHQISMDMTLCRRNVYIHVDIASGPMESGPIPAENFRHMVSPGLNRRCIVRLGHLEALLGEDVDPSPADDSWPEGIPELLGGKKWHAMFNKEVEWSGYLIINTAGMYKFEADVRTGVVLEIDGQRIINRRRVRHGPIVSDPINLEPGFHNIVFRVKSGWGSVNAHLRFHESSPVMAGQVIPPAFYASKAGFSE